MLRINVIGCMAYVLHPSCIPPAHGLGLNPRMLFHTCLNPHAKILAFHHIHFLYKIL